MLGSVASNVIPNNYHHAALAFKPTTPTMLVNNGDTLLYQGNYAQAIKYYESYGYRS